MLDKRFIRDNPDVVKEAVRLKGVDLDVDELLAVDETSRKLQQELDQRQARRKALSKEFANADAAKREQLRAESNELDRQLKQIREAVDETTTRLNELLLITPNISEDLADSGGDIQLVLDQDDPPLRPAATTPAAQPSRGIAEVLDYSQEHPCRDPHLAPADIVAWRSELPANWRRGVGPIPGPVRTTGSHGAQIPKATTAR